VAEKSDNKTMVPPAPDEDSTSSFKMVVTMGGIGLVSGILIVLTFQLTQPIIKIKKALALERAIFEVVSGAETKSVFKLEGTELVPLEGEDESAVKYYACYDSSEALVGLAMEASGQGFQDVLHVLYGYSVESGCVIGMKVLESKETPGLGDKIESDAAFKANFDALEARLAPDGDGIEHPIELVKPGQKENAWQVEGITGATISSRAIATIMKSSTAQTVPVINKNLDVLRKGSK